MWATWHFDREPDSRAPHLLRRPPKVRTGHRSTCADPGEQNSVGTSGAVPIRMWTCFYRARSRYGRPPFPDYGDSAVTGVLKSSSTIVLKLDPIAADGL